MRTPAYNLTAGLTALLLGSALPVAAQEYAGPVGTPVDRNVGDTGPNAASQRLMQPGIGQFGVGSLLLDRYDNKPHTFDRFNPIVGDARTSHRYLMQAPGVTALMSRPDYIGPSPRGGWVFNEQTFDGAEILTYSPDTVFVLSPELLQAPQREAPVETFHPLFIQPSVAGDPYALMRDTRVTGQPTTPIVIPPRTIDNDPNYVHPAIIERRKQLKAERETEEAKINRDDESNSSKIESEASEN